MLQATWTITVRSFLPAKGRVTKLYRYSFNLILHQLWLIQTPFKRSILRVYSGFCRQTWQIMSPSLFLQAHIVFQSFQHPFVWEMASESADVWGTVKLPPTWGGLTKSCHSQTLRVFSNWVEHLEIRIRFSCNLLSRHSWSIPTLFEKHKTSR